MHPLRHPRNAIFVGIAVRDHRRRLLGRPDVGRLARSTTPATTMLVFLGVAMALMAYVLVAGSRRVTGSPRPTD